MTRLAVLAAAALSCSPSSRAPPQEAATPAPPSPPVAAAEPTPAATAEPSSGSTPTPAVPAGPLAMPLRVATATSTGGVLPLAPGSVTVIEVGARFQVEVAVALQDARLSLQDHDGAMIPAAGGAEIGVTWTRFTLEPEAPLAPGSEYVLRLDGAVRRAAHGPDGKPYAPATWALLTAGEKPRPEPKPPARRRR